MTHARGPRRLRGFTYLGLLFIIAIMGLLAAAASSSWSFVEQRERERDLLFIGREYRRAIEAYRLAHAGRPQPYPSALTDLLGGHGEPGPKHYVRRLYVDPFSGTLDWGVVRSPQGGIVGVYSQSERRPLRTTRLYPDDTIEFGEARSYRDWVFAVAGYRSGPVPVPAPPLTDEEAQTLPPLPQWPGGRPPLTAD